MKSGKKSIKFRAAVLTWWYRWIWKYVTASKGYEE